MLLQNAFCAGNIHFRIDIVNLRSLWLFIIPLFFLNCVASSWLSSLLNLAACLHFIICWYFQISMLAQYLLRGVRGIVEVVNLEGFVLFFTYISDIWHFWIFSFIQLWLFFLYFNLNFLLRRFINYLFLFIFRGRIHCSLIWLCICLKMTKIWALIDLWINLLSISIFIIVNIIWTLIIICSSNFHLI